MRCSVRNAVVVVFVLGSLLAASPAEPKGGCQGWEFCLYIPAFDGPDAIGLNVATVLNLQTWKTFRRKPWPDNPHKLDFGDAGISWDTSRLPEQSHQAAERRIMGWDVGAQMVLWGRAYPYGDGVVMQPRLSMPRYDDGRTEKNELWRVTVGGHTVETDLPARRYELPPILLDAGLVERYREPTVMTIYRFKHGSEIAGHIGSSFVGEIIEAEQAQVRSDGIRGWIRYPGLGDRPSGVVDFISGLIRIFRTDWGGAATAMDRVLRNPSVKPRLKFDARLLLGMALERDGESGRELFEAALRTDSDSRAAVSYLIMSDLASLSRAKSQEDRAVIIRRIHQTITTYSQLYADHDPWLGIVRRIVQ